VRKLAVLDLFSGIGGFSLGLERTGGFETKAFCEMKPHAQAVLAKNFPGVPCHSDVTTYPFTEGEADVITAGFPCQDISFAGEGAGLAGARSGLYREVVRALRLVRPRYAVLENVAALLSRGLGTVLGDVAEVGYDAEWHCIPASAAGAPHRRDRIWIVANARGEQHEGYSAPLSGSVSQRLSEAYLANTSDGGYGPDDGPRQNRGAPAADKGEGDQRQWLWPEFGRSGEAVADASGERCSEAGQLRHFEQAQWIAGGCQNVSDAERNGREGERFAFEGERASGDEFAWGAPARGNCEAGPSRGWWATEPGLGRVAHGVPNRVDRLEELGNAVVPQIPEIIGLAILERERAAT